MPGGDRSRIGYLGTRSGGTTIAGRFGATGTWSQPGDLHVAPRPLGPNDRAFGPCRKVPTREKGTETPWVCVAETRHRARGGETVKVVRNGEGGSKRVWEPATRYHRGIGARAPAVSWCREVDSSSWERRRGGKPHGRMDVSMDRRSSAGSEVRSRTWLRSSRAEERPGAVSNRKGNRPEVCSVEHVKVQAARQQGRRRGREAERVATPGSHTLKVIQTL